MFRGLFKKQYKWTLKEDFYIEIPEEFNLPNFENKWGKLQNNNLKINKEYSWDGCTPKRKIFGIMFGTWDGPILKQTGTQALYEPSMVHDFLCQFRIGKRKTNDDIFHWMMKVVEFKLKSIYYNAVLIFGKMFDRRG